MSADSSPARPVPFVRGVVAGQFAWVVGSLATLVVVRSADADAIVASVLGEAVPPPDGYQLVAWVFASAHRVPLWVHPAYRGEPTSPFTVTLLGSDGFSPLLFVVPVVTLAVAGGVVAYQSGSATPAGGLVAGLTVVPGYLVLAVAARMVSTMVWSMGPGGTAGPEPGAMLLAGVAYPAVCAGAAGLLAGFVRGRTGSSVDGTTTESSGAGDQS